MKNNFFNKTNIYLIVLVFFAMIFASYVNGWAYAFTVNQTNETLERFAMNAEEMSNVFGNTYRIWLSNSILSGFYLPIIASVPYFKSRSVRSKNTISKTFQGVYIVFFAEITFFLFAYLFSNYSLSPDMIRGVITYKETFFIHHPIFFLLIRLGTKYIALFTITWFLNSIRNVSSTIIAAFTYLIFLIIIQIILGNGLYLFTLSDYYEHYFRNYGITILILLLISFVLTFYSSKQINSFKKTNRSIPVL